MSLHCDMSQHYDLFALEERFWTGDADFCRDHLDARCLTVLSGMVAALERDVIAEIISKSLRWRTLSIDEKGFVQPTDDVALISYEASAVRGSGEAFKALVSSGYVRRDGGWKMAFHQQTPLRA